MAEDATAVQSAVLAEDAGIRNYRKRLAALKEKNPFEQKFALPEPDSATSGGMATSDSTSSSAGASTAASGADTTAAGAGDSVSNTVESTSVDETTVDQTTVDQTTVDQTTVDEPAGSEGGSEPAQPQPEIRFYAGRIDVVAGPLGSAKKLEGVRPLDFLPNDRAPVAAFIGLGEGGDRAVFSLSRELTETNGEGTCAPKKPNPCEFLSLRVGEQRTLEYGPDGTVYRLKLLDARVVRVPDPRHQQASDQSNSAAD
jgi:hypothetical protein